MLSYSVCRRYRAVNWKDKHLDQDIYATVNAVDYANAETYKW